MAFRIAAAKPDGADFRYLEGHAVGAGSRQARLQLDPFTIRGIQGEVAIAPDLLPTVPRRLLGEIRAARDNEGIVNDGDEGPGDADGIGNGGEGGPVQE